MSFIDILIQGVSPSDKTVACLERPTGGEVNENLSWAVQRICGRNGRDSQASVPPSCTQQFLGNATDGHT